MSHTVYTTTILTTEDSFVNSTGALWLLTGQHSQVGRKEVTRNRGINALLGSEVGGIPKCRRHQECMGAQQTDEGRMKQAIVQGRHKGKEIRPLRKTWGSQHQRLDRPLVGEGAPLCHTGEEWGDSADASSPSRCQNFQERLLSKINIGDQLDKVLLVLNSVWLK